MVPGWLQLLLWKGLLGGDTGGWRNHCHHRRWLGQVLAYSWVQEVFPGWILAIFACSNSTQCKYKYQKSARHWGWKSPKPSMILHVSGFNQMYFPYSGPYVLHFVEDVRCAVSFETMFCRTWGSLRLRVGCRVATSQLSERQQPTCCQSHWTFYIDPKLKTYENIGCTVLVGACTS